MRVYRGEFVRMDLPCNLLNVSHNGLPPPPDACALASLSLIATGPSVQLCLKPNRSRTAVAPLERLKILMQVQGNERVYTGVWQGLARMAQKEGLRGMFKGNGTNCARIIPNSAVKFLSYEYFADFITEELKRQGGTGELGPGLRLVAGACAGIIAMSSTYHLDMVRGRLTVQEGHTTQAYSGIMDAYR